MLHKKLVEARGGGPHKEDGSFPIRQLSLQGEKLFTKNFQEFTEDNHYTLNQIFNCDETGLYYKLLPNKTLASCFEKNADSRKRGKERVTIKRGKERVTINTCFNASGMYYKAPIATNRQVQES